MEASISCDSRFWQQFQHSLPGLCGLAGMFALCFDRRTCDSKYARHQGIFHRENTRPGSQHLFCSVDSTILFPMVSEIVPALLAGEIPQSIQDNGKPTNAVHVLDMAWILPTFGITAVSLWRKQALGYTLAGALLTYIVLLILAILSMVVFMIQGGHPVVVPQVIIFGALLAISLGILIWYLKGLR